jgi:HlyD family secretion protein
MNLLPAELIENGLDAYLAQKTTGSQRLYWLVLLAIAIAFCSLPFIYVDVSVQNSGIIRPVAEKAEIKAGITEFVDSVYVKEGQFLNQGDTILTFSQSNPDNQIGYQQKRLDDFQEHLSDLAYLSKGIQPLIFNSKTREQEYAFYIRQKKEYETNLAKTEKDLQRNQALFDKKIIAGEEYETYQYEYNKAQNTLASLKMNQISHWQNELNVYSNSFEEMKLAMSQSIKEKDRYAVVSPVSGSLDQFNGIYKGSHVQASNLLALISPDLTLYAEVYVSPRNIGYLHIDMPVNIQVSSFNYNEWGTISGHVIEISSDFLTDNSGNNAFYKVKCSLTQDYLIRKNGVTGRLKKGMTVSCHFLIARRSLFDLLYQKMDDWINPTQNDNNTNQE